MPDMKYSEADQVATPARATEWGVAHSGNPESLSLGQVDEFVHDKGSDVASAATVTLGDGHYFHITGTTTITDIDFTDSFDGRYAILVFDGSLTLTHNGTTLNLPGGANIQTQAGDVAIVVVDAGDNVKVVHYLKAANPVARSPVYNASAANQGAGFSSDTYLTGSSIAIPAGALKVGTMYRCVFNVTKTNAGTATPIINVRIGTNGTTGDTSRGTLTFSAQTAATDEGTFEVRVTFRSVGGGTSAVIQSLGQLRHRQSVTGLGTGVSEPEVATSGGFDSTVANLIIGLSVNGGASASWTVNLVQAELVNLA
jgi:hypothetical protein